MTSELEVIEADVRRAMARHAAIVPRGFDTLAQRNRLHAEIDRLLDRYHGDVPKGSREQAALLAVYERNADHGSPEATVCGICSFGRFLGAGGGLHCRICDHADRVRPTRSLDGAE